MHRFKHSTSLAKVGQFWRVSPTLASTVKYTKAFLGVHYSPTFKAAQSFVFTASEMLIQVWLDNFPVTFLHVNLHTRVCFLRTQDIQPLSSYLNQSLLIFPTSFQPLSVLIIQSKYTNGLSFPPSVLILVSVVFFFLLFFFPSGWNILPLAFSMRSSISSVRPLRKRYCHTSCYFLKQLPLILLTWITSPSLFPSQHSTQSEMILCVYYLLKINLFPSPTILPLPLKY